MSKSVDRVVVRLKVFVSLLRLVRILVHGVDKSSYVSFEAAWYQPSFDGCLGLRKPDMVELFRTALFDDFLREEIRLNFGSRMLLDCPNVQWVLVLFSAVILPDMAWVPTAGSGSQHISYLSLSVDFVNFCYQ